MYRRILVASDGSPGAAKAVETAILLARRFKAELHMICVEDLPLVIEIVDSPEKIDAFLPELEGMMGSGLVTLEKVQVLQYGANGKG